MSRLYTQEIVPTALRSGPYRLFFCSSERSEPLHVCVEREDAKAKFWLLRIRLEKRYKFSRAELNAIEVLVTKKPGILERDLA